MNVAPAGMFVRFVEAGTVLAYAARGLYGSGGCAGAAGAALAYAVRGLDGNGGRAPAVGPRGGFAGVPSGFAGVGTG